MAEYTPNLNLYKPNRYDELEVDTTLASNFEKIDTEVGNVNTQLADITLNVKNFGAKGDGVTDDTVAIQQAFDSLTKGQFVLIPDGTFKVSNVIFKAPDDCGLIMRGTLLSNTNGTALTIGDASSYRYRYNVQVKVITTTTQSDPVVWQAGSIGVKVVNLYTSKIDIKDVYGFETNVLFEGTNNIGNSLNEIHIEKIRNGKKSLRLTSNNGGYCTENTFYNGSFQFGSNISNFTDTVHLTIDHDPVNLLDNNHFIRPCFESPSTTSKAAVLNGDRGSIFMPRSEGSRTFEITSNATYWYLIGTFLNRVDIIDNGKQTKIFDNETMTFNGRNETGGIITGHNRAGNPYDVFVGLAFDRTKTFRVDGNGRMYISASGVLIGAGSGTPEGVITAPVGSIWSRTDGTLGSNVYIKNSGTGSTGWLALHPLTSGTTANRPLLPPNPYMYFDTTLNKPIFHRGSNVWVDAMGTTV